VLGFSLGGHVTLCHALRPSDARLRAVASVCAPLDLAAGCSAIDHPRAAVYCGHVLAGLKEIYTAVARRRAGADAAGERAQADDDPRLGPAGGGAPLRLRQRRRLSRVVQRGPAPRQVQVPALVLSATRRPDDPGGHGGAARARAAGRS
jgi:pimeloyl-ACP methyl ester carboxylesterase